ARGARGGFRRAPAVTRDPGRLARTGAAPGHAPGRGRCRAGTRHRRVPGFLPLALAGAVVALHRIEVDRLDVADDALAGAELQCAVRAQAPFKRIDVVELDGLGVAQVPAITFQRDQVGATGPGPEHDGAVTVTLPVMQLRPADLGQRLAARVGVIAAVLFGRGGLVAGGGGTGHGEADGEDQDVFHGAV